MDNILFTWHTPYHTSRNNQSQRTIDNIVRDQDDRTILTKSCSKKVGKLHFDAKRHVISKRIFFSQQTLV